MAINVETISQEDMQYDYYEINPPSHAEAAYQPGQGDQFPPVSSVASPSANGEFVAMMTTVNNIPSFGTAKMELVDFRSFLKFNKEVFNKDVFPTPEQAQQIIQAHPEIVCARLTGATPFVVKVNCEGIDWLTLRPLTGGYMSKVISKRDYDKGRGRPPL
jgi:hypothetical protein